MFILNLSKLKLRDFNDKKVGISYTLMQKSILKPLMDIFYIFRLVLGNHF